MKNYMKFKSLFSLYPLLVALLLIVQGCSKDEFAVKKKEDKLQAPLTFNSSSSICANHTLIKPQVDFLFLWDNSSSQFFVTDATKQALANTINLISSRFDYRILLAPLIVANGSSVNQDSFLVSSSMTGLSGTALTRLISPASAPNVLSTYTTSPVAEERGIERSISLINNNISNGIFRQNSYTIIVVMSNGNDQRNTSNGWYDPVATNNYLNTQRTNLQTLKDTTLHSSQLRFISLVAHSNCQTNWRQGTSYLSISDFVYNLPYNNGGVAPNDQSGSSTPDSYNICTTDFVHLFDGVNNSILDTVIAHKYDFWPVSYQQSPLLFNPATIRVQKNTGEEFFEVAGSGAGDGWSYIGWQADHPTTYEPFVGENRSAHMIQLYGNARVSYPECLIISADSPTYYYGYVALSSKPVTSSIKLTINGVQIPQSSTNGWEYLGFTSSINLRIQGPNNPSDPHQEALPADSRSDVHVLKLNGNAIYKNGDVVNIVYDPSAS